MCHAAQGQGMDGGVDHPLGQTEPGFQTLQSESEMMT